mmetsp:Transcript_25028/g.27737  ORF Transcript_25028/g.27737 Transcript_25028/m.27737 type:complete len:84 (+) Transcript_25028:864-1115(+)
MSYFTRFFLIALVSQYALDLCKNKVPLPEFWAPSSYVRPPVMAFNVYEPFTLAYHKGYIDGHVIEGIEETAGLTPDLKPLKVV